MTKRIFITVLLYLIIGLSNLYSQDVRATATIDTNNVLIGDQIHLNLQVKSDKKVKITWSPLQDTIGKLEILSRTKIDTVDSNGIYLQRQRFTITSFDSGTHEIPPFVFLYEKKGINEPYPIQTDTLYLHFNTVEVDTAKPIKDIKAPWDEPVTFAEYLPYIGLILGVIALGFAGYYLWRRWKQKRRRLELGYDPNIRPHVLALEALKQLESEKLWQSGKVKQYYIRLSEILRIYMERRFEFLAMELTTDEIIPEMKSKEVEQGLVQKMYDLLSLADLVKFAKYIPLPDRNSHVLSVAYEFVYQTISFETAITGESTEQKSESDVSDKVQSQPTKNPDENKTMEDSTK